MKVTIADGKYTVVCDEVKGLRALRYGEEWRDLTGDNLVAELALEIEDLRAAIEAVRQRMGEPVAWMAEDGRVCSTETRNNAMPNVSRVLFNIPLYRGPQPSEPVKVPSVGYTNEETAQRWYDLAWEVGARKNLSFDGDEIVSVNFDTAELESFCRALLARFGRDAQPATSAEPVGEAQDAGPMYPSGTTKALFRALSVPAGTKLYAAPTLPADGQP